MKTAGGRATIKTIKWLAALGQYPCCQPSRSPLGAALLRLLHDRSQAAEFDRRSAYDSDPLDEELRRDCIAMIAPHRANRTTPPTQDRRRLSRYMRRWLVERFFAWIQWRRRILALGVPHEPLSQSLITTDQGGGKRRV